MNISNRKLGIFEVRNKFPQRAAHVWGLYPEQAIFFEILQGNSEIGAAFMSLCLELRFLLNV